MQAKADLKLGSGKLGRKLKHQSGYRQRGQGTAPKNLRLNKSRTGKDSRYFQVRPTVNTSSPKWLGLEGENRSCSQGTDSNLLRPLGWVCEGAQRQVNRSTRS